jgi:flagellar biogenesis protein FliO
VKLAPLSSGRVERPVVLAGLCTAFAVLAAMAGGDLAGGALRAIAVVALLAAAAALVRRRSGRFHQHAALVVEERHLLGKESGVAIVTMSGRRLLVGFGTDEVTLLAEITSAAEEVTP